MKEKMSTNKYILWGITAFCVLSALILVFFLVYRWNYVIDFFKMCLGIIMPFIYGLVIAYLLNPVVNFFEKKVFTKLLKKYKNKGKGKISRTMSLFTSTLIFLGCLVTLFNFFMPELFSSLDMFIDNANNYFSNSKEMLVHVFGGSDSVRNFLDNNYDTVQKFFVDWLNDGYLNGMMLTLSNGIFSTFKFLYNLLLGYIVAIYILYDKEKFRGQVLKIIYALCPSDKINILLENVKYTDKIFGDFFSAKLIDSSIIGVLCFIGMLIFDMPYALIIAVIVGVTNIIPYFGPFIGAIPSAFLILLVAPGKCITFIIFVFILQQFDGNILGPKILGGKTGLSSFWVLFSLLIFGGLFGVVGMIIAVPIFSILYQFVNGLIKKRLEDKNLPLDSKEYV